MPQRYIDQTLGWLGALALFVVALALLWGLILRIASTSAQTAFARGHLDTAEARSRLVLRLMTRWDRSIGVIRTWMRLAQIAWRRRNLEECLRCAGQAVLVSEGRPFLGGYRMIADVLEANRELDAALRYRRLECRWARKGEPVGLGVADHSEFQVARGLLLAGQVEEGTAAFDASAKSFEPLRVAKMMLEWASALRDRGCDPKDLVKIAGERAETLDHLGKSDVARQIREEAAAEAGKTREPLAPFIDGLLAQKGAA